MQITISRMKSIWPWLKEARFAWLTIGVIGIALMMSLRPHTSEPTIRLTGLFLQLLGIGTVAWGISETRTLFGHPSFASKIMGWLGRFPLRKRNIILSASGTSFATASSNARGHVKNNPGPNPTIDARVVALERNQ